MKVNVIDNDEILQIELTVESEKEEKNLFEILSDVGTSSVRQYMIYPKTRPINSVRICLEGGRYE